MKDVVVVGGGAAGFACAKVLHEANTRITLLEASDRVGGRIRTTTLPFVGHCELGATWLHGTRGNAAHKIASAIGALDGDVRQPRRQNNLWVCPSGQGVASDMLRDVHGVFHSALDACEEGEVDEASAREIYGDRLGSYLKEQWALTRPKLLAKYGDGDLLDSTWAWVERLQCAIDGCAHLTDQALQSYSNYNELQGPHVLVPKGFSRIVEAIAEPLLAAGAVNFGCEVVAVRWAGQAAGEAHSAAGERVEVCCKDGRTFSADAAVVAVPISQLQKIEFTPPLPERNARALASLDLGKVEKIFVTCERRGADGDGLASNGAEAEALGEGIPSVSLLWPTPADDGESAEHPWPRSLYHLGPGEGVSDSNTLVGWLTGPAAVEAARKSPEQLLADLVKELAWVWEGPLRDWLPVSCQSSQWTANPHIQGSYSYPLPGAAMTVADDLASPLVDGRTGHVRIAICGEATSRHHFGTAHGAIVSGLREAARLLGTPPEKAARSLDTTVGV